MSKKLFIILLCLLGLINTAFAQDSTPAQLDIELPPDAINQNDEFTVNLRLTSTNEIYTGAMSLSFNPAQLEAISVTGGDFFTGSGTEIENKIDNVAGSIRYGYSLLGTATQGQGEGTFVTIVFRAKNAGETAIGIREASFSRLILQQGNPPSSESVDVTFSEPITFFIQGGDEEATTSGEATTSSQNTEETSTQEAATSSSEESSSESSTSLLPIAIGGTLIVIILVALLLGRRRGNKPKSSARPQTTGAAPTAKRNVHARLIFYDNTDKKETYKGPTEFELHGSGYRVGRDNSEGATIVIPYSGVSRLQLEIVRKAPFLYSIRDMNSLNGTYIVDVKNGQKTQLPPAEPYPLEHGNLIFMGDHLSFRFAIENMQAGGDEARTTRLVTDEDLKG